MPTTPFVGFDSAEAANDLSNWLQHAELQPLVEAWQTGRLAVVWGATPFELAPAPASRPVVINQWQEQAQSLPALGYDIDLNQLPRASIRTTQPLPPGGQTCSARPWPSSRCLPAQSPAARGRPA